MVIYTDTLENTKADNTKTRLSRERIRDVLQPGGFNILYRKSERMANGHSLRELPALSKGLNENNRVPKEQPGIDLKIITFQYTNVLNK